MKRHLPLILLVAAALALGGAAYAAFRVTHTDHAEAALATATVVRGDLHREVSFTGTVVPATDADLSFERGGTIAYVGVKAGDTVSKGQTLASLSAADLSAQVSQARAGVAAAQARLDAIIKGARPEALAVQDAQVAAATSAADEARTALLDRVTDAYAKADDAVRGKTDPFFIDPQGATPHLSFDPLDTSLASALSQRRVVLETELKQWQASFATLTADSDLSASSFDAKAKLADVSSFLADCAGALDRTTVSANPSLAQPTLDGYKAGVSAARASLNAAVSALSVGEQGIRATQSALALAQSQRTLGAAPATAEDIAAQQAVIRQAQAATDAALAQLGKTALRSPVSGTVAHVNIAVGEAASPSVVAISVLSGDRYEIDALASEDQIAALHVGNDAAVTLDAYGTSTTFAATVARIDPAPATRNGQTGYPVTIRFAQDDTRVKVGMTANADISGDSRAGALLIPRGALLSDDAGASVMLRKDGRFVRTPIKIGIVTQDQAEVTDGLSEGDVVADLSAAAR